MKKRKKYFVVIFLIHGDVGGGELEMFESRAEATKWKRRLLRRLSAHGWSAAIRQTYGVKSRTRGGR